MNSPATLCRQQHVARELWFEWILDYRVMQLHFYGFCVRACVRACRGNLILNAGVRGAPKAAGLRAAAPLFQNRNKRDDIKHFN